MEAGSLVSVGESREEDFSVVLLKFKSLSSWQEESLTRQIFVSTCGAWGACLRCYLNKAVDLRKSP